ncbi:MAG: hypothetical protein ACFB6R_14400 [Alphaproteobacteria bacterium]
MGFVRVVIGFVLAWAVGLVVFSVTHTQFVIQRMTGLGVPISIQERLDWTMTDLVGLNDFSAPSEILPVILLIALLVGFGVAAGLTRLFRGLRLPVFLTAGFCAVVALLLVLETALGLMPIAGARGLGPQLVHGLAGLVAGAVFVTLTAPPRRASA